MPKQYNNILSVMPSLNFAHIRNLTDDTGIIQHALHTIPNRKEGYCIDDNSRALLLTVLACRQSATKEMVQLMTIYLSFIHYMQTENGHFRNFIDYSRHSTEEYGSEDAFGRTIMALGYLVQEGPNAQVVQIGAEIFVKAAKHVHHLVSLRGIACSIIGFCQYARFNAPDDISKQTVISLSNKLVRAYQDNTAAEWNWFDNIVTYDNAFLPLALLHAFELTQDKTYYEIAIASIRFLESVVFSGNTLRPVGNQGWYKNGNTCPEFDQQGVDAMAMVLFYEQAFLITKEEQYLLKMKESHYWFLGKNDLQLSLYDPATGGCYDGLQKEGVNYNQGAESTIAYWISHLVLLAALEEPVVAYPAIV